MKPLILKPEDIAKFQDMIWQFYRHHGRSFPWRYILDPYQVLVSEVMLQQTQTFRVQEKFKQFITTFPTVQVLAHAPWPEVLIAWQGLGYNTRAKRLQNIALRIEQEFNGHVPQSSELLNSFSGIGKATAASICAFAFNAPTVFAETNIRAVYIFHFFPGADLVSDNEILPLVEQTLDKSDPRSWYYALTDYGVSLKKIANNPSRRSRHYTRQSKFEGSDRQIRSTILKLLITYKSISVEELIQKIKHDQERVKRIIKELCKEDLIIQYGPSCSQIISLTQ